MPKDEMLQGEERCGQDEASSDDLPGGVSTTTGDMPTIAVPPPDEGELVQTASSGDSCGQVWVGSDSVPSAATEEMARGHEDYVPGELVRTSSSALMPLIDVLGYSILADCFLGVFVCVFGHRSCARRAQVDVPALVCDIVSPVLYTEGETVDCVSAVVSAPVGTGEFEVFVRPLLSDACVASEASTASLSSQVESQASTATDASEQEIGEESNTAESEEESRLHRLQATDLITAETREVSSRPKSGAASVPSQVESQPFTATDASAPEIMQESNRPRSGEESSTHRVQVIVKERVPMITGCMRGTHWAWMS